MAQTSFALMTNVGRAKEAAALANGTSITITHIAIGDGATVPSGGETALYHEVARKTISGHGTVIGADNVAYFDCYLAAAEGPYTIREAGLYDADGAMIAIAYYNPSINKPVPSSGQTVEGTVRLEVAFSNVATVIIAVDPSMLVALQRLTRLPWIPINELNRNDPPAAPVPGDVYVVGSAPTGSWVGNSGKVAEYTLAGWAMITPPNGHGISIPDGRVYERIAGSYVEKIALDVQSGKWVYAPDTGTPNAMVITQSPAPLSYVAGMEVAVKKMATANTATAVTINVNALGEKAVVLPNGKSPGIGDLAAGQMLRLAYDGTKFQIVSATGGAVVPRNCAVLTATVGGNFVVPAGVYRLFIELIGGGGGGGGGGPGNGGSGGGAAMYIRGVKDVVPGQVIPWLVGAGGVNGNGGSGSAGGQGGTTSILGMTSTGGGPGQAGGSSSGGAAGGGGGGGDFSAYAGGGQIQKGTIGGDGGGSYYGTGGIALTSVTSGTAGAPGAGGAGGWNSQAGGGGANGLIVITY